MARRISLKQIKENVDNVEKYLESHSAYGGPENWPTPGHKDYWPVRWIQEYLLIIKNEYYRKSARKKEYEKKKKSKNIKRKV